MSTVEGPDRVDYLHTDSARDLLVASCAPCAYVRMTSSIHHTPLLGIKARLCYLSYETVTGLILLAYGWRRYGICRDKNLLTSSAATASPYVTLTLLPTRHFQYWLQAPGTGQFIFGTPAPTGTTSPVVFQCLTPTLVIRWDILAQIFFLWFGTKPSHRHAPAGQPTSSLERRWGGIGRGYARRKSGHSEGQRKTERCIEWIKMRWWTFIWVSIGSCRKLLHLSLIKRHPGRLGL